MMNGKLDARIAKLSQQIEVEQARYKAAVATAVKDVLSHYGIALDALDELVTPPTRPAKKVTVTKPPKAAKGNGKRKAPFKGPQPPKYQDPATGNTWSGFGHAPAWIAGAKDRTKFLIDGAA